jgi:hypothetical protein
VNPASKNNLEAYSKVSFELKGPPNTQKLFKDRFRRIDFTSKRDTVDPEYPI